MTVTAVTATVNKAVVYSEPGTINTKVLDLPIEEPGPGQILVRMLYSGVCHTDYAFCANSWTPAIPPTPKDQIGGHEGVGEVVALGPGVSVPVLGTKVGIKYAADACLVCDRCLEGAETLCANSKVSGYYTAGTFQQYCITSANYASIIPEGVDLAAAAPLMCGGVTVYAAIKRSNLKNGQWVLVVGAGGGLGHLAIQYAKALGLRVLAVDAPSKEQFCLQLGADAFVDFTKYNDEDYVTQIKTLTKNGAKIVLMCSSSNKAYAQAMKCLDYRGILWCIGVPEGDVVPIQGSSPMELIGFETTITAIKSGNRLEAKECLDIAARGLVKCHYELKPMDGLSQIFKDMEDGRINGRQVIDLR